MKHLTFKVLFFFTALATYGQSTAIYDIVFTSNWEAHGPLPGANAHFTELVGATHNGNITFLRNGGISTLGVEDVAETGNSTNFNREVNNAINAGNADQFIEGPNLFFTGTRRTITIADLEVDSRYPLISLLSMIAPSPDWMIAINSVSLVDGSNEWIQNITLDIFPYDAGTEEGTTYSLNNPVTNPKEPISSLRGTAPFNSQRVGRLVFTLKSVTGGGEPDECSGDVSSFPYNESFEGSIGDWSQATRDDLDWTVDANGTPSNGTGPDSAIDGNSYIYVEASGNGTGFPTKNAILNSPCLDFSNVSAPTLNFQYHMIGSAAGTLTIEARTDNSGDWESVFSLSGEQGTGWNEASIDLSEYEGDNSVQLRLNAVTGNSWQGDITIDALSITSGSTNPPSSDCDILDFDDFTISSFATQDGDGDFSVTNGEDGLSLSNNTWKFIAMDYEVTANTVLEFDFASTSQGEIHAVGFDDDNELTQTRYFKVHGTQDYGVTNFDNYAGGTTTYAIPVGNFYTGVMDRLVFINDNDAGSGNNSSFTNVRIYDGSCNQSRVGVAASFGPQTPVLGTEDEVDISIFSITPNPLKSGGILQVTMDNTTNVNTPYTIINMVGQIVGQGIITSSKNINVGNLKSGMYLLKIQGNAKPLIIE